MASLKLVARGLVNIRNKKLTNIVDEPTVTAASSCLRFPRTRHCNVRCH